MTALRRKATIRDFPMPFLCNNHCDICSKPRASGDNSYKHTKCSKIRQARYAAERAQSKIKRAGQPAGGGGVMSLTTRQVIAMRNIAHSLKEFYSDCDAAVTDFISPGWIAVIDDRTALICEQCHGEGQVGGLTPDGYDSEKCDACDGTGLNLEKH